MEKIQCTCGCLITRHNIARHLKTRKHYRRSEYIKTTDTTKVDLPPLEVIPELSGAQRIETLTVLKKTPIDNLPIELQDIIYEYAQDRTIKDNFIKILPQLMMSTPYQSAKRAKITIYDHDRFEIIYECGMRILTTSFRGVEDVVTYAKRHETAGTIYALAMRELAADRFFDCLAAYSFAFDTFDMLNVIRENEIHLVKFLF